MSPPRVNPLWLNMLRPPNRSNRDRQHYKTGRPKSVHAVSESVMEHRSLSFAYENRPGMASHVRREVSSSTSPVTARASASPSFAFAVYIEMRPICEPIVLVPRSGPNKACRLPWFREMVPGLVWLSKKSGTSRLANLSSLPADLINDRQRPRQRTNS